MWSTNKNNNNCNLEIFPINENTSNNISNNFTLTNRISNEKSKIASTINDINKTISLYSDKNKNINLEKFMLTTSSLKLYSHATIKYSRTKCDEEFLSSSIF